MILIFSKKYIEDIWKELRKHTSHISVINDEMGEVQEQTAHIPAIRNDIKWLKWLIGAIFLGVAIGLLEQFLGI